LSVKAYGKAIFDGKVEGEKRAAANDPERKQAVEYVVTTDPQAKRLKKLFDAAQRDVTFYRGWNENVQLIARMFLAQAK